MKFSHLLAAAALCLPLSVMAEMSYSYLEGGYRYGELASEEGDGFDIEVNFLLGEFLYFSANLDEIEYDSDLQFDRFGLGIGAHFNVFDKTDIYGVVSYEDLEFDVPFSADFHDKGWGAEVGVRYDYDETWEFRAAVDYADYEDEGFEITSTYFVGTAVYNLSQNYALVGEYNGGEIVFDTINRELEENNVRIALRVQF